MAQVNRFCSNCHHFEPSTDELEEKGKGWCHRFPPVKNGDTYSFPRTLVTDWCGEIRFRQFPSRDHKNKPLRLR